MNNHFDVQVSGDYYEDNSRFNVYLDGIKYGPTLAVTAAHSQGQTEFFGFTGDFSAVHQISFKFINDNGGSAGQDRNIYISSFNYDGVSQSGTAAAYNTGATTPYSAELYRSNESVGFNVNGYTGPIYALNDSDHTLGNVYRFFDTKTGDHFYTTSAVEKAQIQATIPWFNYEGTPWSTPDAGADTHDVFRFFDTKTGTHFLTDSVNERDTVMATQPNFKYEGVAFAAYNDAGGAGQITLERFYNTQTGQHHFAGNAEEATSINQGLQGPGWVDEGKAFTVHLPTDGMLHA